MAAAIYVCPLSRLEETVEQTGARFVVTAINPWSIPKTPATVLDDNHLRLAINDVDAPFRDLVHPETHHIEQLIAFGQRWQCDGPLIVHCLAGISRSSACAFIVACALNPDVPESRIATSLRDASDTAHPNPLMIELADQSLRRGGRMIAAIEAISPGLATMEAETYSIPSRY